MAYSKEHREFRANGLSDWEPYIIPEEPLKLPDDSGLVIHEDGRVSIGYKTEFIATAQKEVIEVGVRLKTFSEYFTSRRENEYKDYISTLLKKGVSFKAYLLDPDSNEARLYFDDRARVQESESDAIAEMKKAIEKLIRIAKEFEQNRYPGSFEIYIYKHIPYNHFLVVDRQLEGGKMMVSHYLYATRRAECPVWEFRRSTHPKLYEMYHRSLVSFVQHAKRLP